MNLKWEAFSHRFLHSKEQRDWHLKMKLRQRRWWKATIDFTHSEQALLTCVGALKKNKRKRTYAHSHVNICLIIQAYWPRFDNATSNTSLGWHFFFIGLLNFSFLILTLFRIVSLEDAQNSVLVNVHSLYLKCHNSVTGYFPSHAFIIENQKHPQHTHTKNAYTQRLFNIYSTLVKQFL